MLDPVHQEGEEEPPLQQPCAAGALQRRRGPHWHVHDAGQHDGETQGTGKPQCVRVCLQLEEEACVDGPNRGEPHTYTYLNLKPLFIRKGTSHDIMYICTYIGLCHV